MAVVVVPVFVPARAVLLGARGGAAACTRRFYHSFGETLIVTPRKAPMNRTGAFL